MASQAPLPVYIKALPFLPGDNASGSKYTNYLGGPNIQRWEYTGYRDECSSWKETCYLCTMLNPISPIHVWGPDATKSLVENTANSYKKFGVGRGKHVLFCSERGNIINDGVLLRVAEDEYIGYCIPWWMNVLTSGGYDAQFEFLAEDTLIQVGGPTSLQTLEKACGESLRDIKFMAFRNATIAGHTVRIMRVGMAGSLGYEVHGTFENSHEVYEAIYEAGKEFGIKRLGAPAYTMTHFESGFPNSCINFMFDADFGLDFTSSGGGSFMQGSAGDDYEMYMMNPFELGWGKTVRFDHDFVGREALEKIAEHHREIVTLIWNPEDVLDVISVMFKDEEQFAVDITMPDDCDYHPQTTLHTDLVFDGDKQVGITSGRMISANYKCMLSLAFLEPEYAAEGTELEVLWGNPGTRQQRIRATVARYPYLDVERNDKVDVNSIAPVL